MTASHACPDLARFVAIESLPTSLRWRFDTSHVGRNQYRPGAKGAGVECPSRFICHGVAGVAGWLFGGDVWYLEGSCRNAGTPATACGIQVHLER